MSDLAKIEVESLGPVAVHNFPCPCCRQRHAILNLSNGVMQPCHECSANGWELKQRTRHKGIFLRTAEAMFSGGGA